MNLLKIIIVVILFTACNNNKNTKIERAGEPDIYTVESNDKKMNASIDYAKKTLGVFDNALKSENKNYYDFALKVRFNTTNGGGEHMWVNSIELANNKYSGIVGNEPEETKEVKLGDSIQIDSKNITDWMYIEQGKLKGGYTIRVMYNSLSDVEKKKFESDFGFKIEN
jgi:uncharacterized protein YegJ (DUF2314 family)